MKASQISKCRPRPWRYSRNVRLPSQSGSKKSEEKLNFIFDDDGIPLSDILMSKPMHPCQKRVLALYTLQRILIPELLAGNVFLLSAKLLLMK